MVLSFRQLKTVSTTKARQGPAVRDLRVVVRAHRPHNSISGEFGIMNNRMKKGSRSVRT